jgi:hypothetical protein
MKIHRVWRLVQRVIAVVQEMNDAQKRMLALRMATDQYLINPSAPPDTYEEFLMRTSGLLVHEPSADKRADGRPRGAR